MKASELRIGNWIYNDRSRSQYEVPSQEISLVGYILDHYEPIPLTEEWLLKFGFENNKLSVAGILEFVYHKGSVYIRGISGAIHPRDCQYVHQLQNLYHALTGEELTIE